MPPIADRRSYVTHLEAAIDGTILPARTVQTTHDDRPLWVRYDLEGQFGSFGEFGMFEDDGSVAAPATMTVLHNGVPVNADGFVPDAVTDAAIRFNRDRITTVYRQTWAFEVEVRAAGADNQNKDQQYTHHN